MKKYPRPTVVVSACLEFENVRYNGGVIPCELIRKLTPFADFVKVCPECEIGLGVPRETVRMVKDGNEYRLLQPKTGRDVTEPMRAFTDAFLGSLRPVDGFIFKSGSPTHGLMGIRVYKGPFDPMVVEKTSGFFTKKVIEKYHGYPMEEDARLINSKIRDHFLTRLFAFAGFREVKSSAERFYEFHENNRCLFMAHSRDMCKELDDIIAKNKGDDAYFQVMKTLLAKMPEPGDFVETSHGIFSRYADLVTPDEKKWFLESVDLYEKNKICLNGLLEALKLFIVRSGDVPMMRQSLFERYPPVLLPDVDEARDRDYMKNIIV